MPSEILKLEVKAKSQLKTKSTTNKDIKTEPSLFDKMLNKNKQNNDLQLSKVNKSMQNIGVGIQRIEQSKMENILRFEPNHPDANKDGYVAYPNINPVIEMTDLIEAMRSYEANLSAFQTQKTMDDKTIDLLKG